jgi:GNAT superfamily N-acetyltransferase
MGASEPVIPIRMIRPDLVDLPDHKLPAPYSLRWYRPGDERDWVRIAQRADIYNKIDESLFGRQFGDDTKELARRQCYLCDVDGIAIGTATAWFDDDPGGRRWGRVHWVDIIPEYHGRGLGKALVAAVCRRLRELGHDRAYLTTESPRIPAIRLYER